MALPKKLYVVGITEYIENPEWAVWTVSGDPEETGWETDAAQPGYGITLNLAEEICRCYNSVER